MNLKKSNANIAHVKRLENGAWAEPHYLDSHLAETANLVKKFSNIFGSGEWGKTLGFFHDTGKSTDEWQKYLIKKSGFGEDDAHLEGKARTIDHSTPSAKLAEELFGKGIGRLLVYCIAGHHAGLPDWYPDEAGGQSALSYRLNNATTNKIKPEFKANFSGLHPGNPPWKFDNQTNKLDLSLWIRMLFSCLVDADFLDTEKYMDTERTENRGGYLSMEELLVRFNSYMAEKAAGADKTKVNEIRQTVLTDCRKAAINNPGIFSLTVPTGGGKTLSSLAFALEHAVKHKQDRVIYVIPYTSIIEQNADVFRQALGDDQVVEHHSSLDEEDSTAKSRLSAENWDAPIVVTTSVQFFESLFAAKSSRCRKLHNIVNSIVVLDEAQLVPVEYLLPILQTIELLSRRYNVSFVISTATQPAFESREGFKGLTAGSVHEIISDVPKLYRELNRVKVTTPDDWENPKSWECLANELAAEPRVLCVVSDRKSCRDLYNLMPVGTYHLSALMCGQHRSDTISEIKQKLKTNEPVRVISTQLVEAGVDFDFPVVYRALAGLDSIAQAAGRCNREGKLEAGKTVVFISPKKAPPGILRKAADTTETMLKNSTEDPLNYKNFEKFFGDLYWKANSLDAKNIIGLLSKDIAQCEIQFRTAAEKFRIIDDTKQRTILVTYGKGKELIAQLKAIGPERWLLRKLQRHSVNIYTKDFAAMLDKGWIAEIVPNIFALTSEVGYDFKTGLLVNEIPFDPDKFTL
ncbi:MAG: CRISPR-associated helicase Cas3' [Chitinivibrionales bacterium]|nr:CRISPR-associated helicase Cas3' [Chitinivibrionales bacterium]